MLKEKVKNLVSLALAGCFLLGFLVWGILRPDADTSLTERRPLAQAPELSTKTLLNGSFMTNFESYTLDQFPLRDTFRTVKALSAFYVFRQSDSNGIYIADGHAAKLEYPMDTDSIDRAAERFQDVYDRYLAGTDAKIYSVVVPDKSYFLAAKNGYLSMDYDAFFARFIEKTPFAENIPVADLLEAEDYYRTDLHWRQERIGDVAARIAERMDVTLKDDYSVNEADAPFYGVYYGQSALPLPAERLYYLTSDTLEDCRVFDYETEQYLPVYDLSAPGGSDPYEIFLFGSKSLLTVENPNAETERELIIFRDSFGSSIAPLLIEGYAKVTLVDIRYLSPMLLGSFLTFDGQDVLFLYSTSVLNNSITLK